MLHSTFVRAKKKKEKRKKTDRGRCGILVYIPMLHSVVTPKCSTDIENQTHIRTHSLHAQWFHFLPKKMSRKKKINVGHSKIITPRART